MSDNSLDNSLTMWSQVGLHFAAGVLLVLLPAWKLTHSLVFSNNANIGGGIANRNQVYIFASDLVYNTAFFGGALAQHAYGFAAFTAELIATSGTSPDSAPKSWNVVQSSPATPVPSVSPGRPPAAHFHSLTHYFWQAQEMWPDLYCQLHPEKAARLGIANGDWMWIETRRGRMRQRAKVTKGIDPRVISAQHGWWFPDEPAPDYGVWKSNVNLLTEQAAALYDYRRRKLFVLESASEEMQRIALVHELAHALADQHFNLERFIERVQNDDSAVARAAVMEGQAQWLMLEVTVQKMGMSLTKSRALAERMANLGGSSGSAFSELAKAPLYLRETLMFPYTSGMLFQQAVVERSDKAGFGRYFHQSLENGVYFAPSQFEAGFISLAHSPDDMARTADVVAKALVA